MAFIQKYQALRCLRFYGFCPFSALFPSIDHGHDPLRRVISFSVHSPLRLLSVPLLNSCQDWFPATLAGPQSNNVCCPLLSRQPVHRPFAHRIYPSDPFHHGSLHNLFMAAIHYKVKENRRYAVERVSLLREKPGGKWESLAHFLRIPSEKRILDLVDCRLHRFSSPCRCISHMRGGLLLPQRLIFQCPFSSSRQFFAVVLTAGAHRLGLAVEHHLDGLHTPAAEMQTAPSLLCCRRLGAVLAGAWQTRKQSFIRSSPKPRSQQGYFQGVRSCQRQSEWADQSRRQILPEGAR